MPAYQDKNGTWYAAFYAKEANGHNKHIVKRGFSRKKESLAYEYDYKAHKMVTSSIPFYVLVNNFYDYHKCRVNEETHNTTKFLIERFILPYFSDMKLSDINTKTIIAWQNDLQSKNQYKPTYLYSINGKLKLIFNYAKRTQGLLTNPADDAGSIGKAKANHNDFWTIDEFTYFLSILTDKSLQKKHKIRRKIDDKYLVLAFKILFFGGLRISELIKLKVQDVYIDNNITTLRVQKGKTNASIRWVDLPVHLYDALRDYISSIPDDYPSTDVFMPMITRDNIRRALNSGAKLAGLNHLRIHDLRHSHASLLYKLQVPAKEASIRLGHASVSTTLDIYTHISRKRNNNIGNKIDLEIAKRTDNK